MESQQVVCKECGKRFYLSYEAFITDYRGMCYDCNLQKNARDLKEKCEKYDALFPGAIITAFEKQSATDALKQSNLQAYASLSDADFDCICYILTALEYFCEKGIWSISDISFAEFYKLYEEQHYSAFPTAAGMPFWVFLTTRGRQEDRFLIEAETESDALVEKDNTIKRKKDFYCKMIPQGLLPDMVFENKFSDKEWEDFIAKRFYVYDFVMGEHSKSDKKTALEYYFDMCENKIPVSDFERYEDVIAEEMEEEAQRISAEERAMNFFRRAEVISSDCGYMMNDEADLYDNVLAYDLYIAYAGCRIIGTEKWLELFTEYVLKWSRLLLGGDGIREAFEECNDKEKAWPEKLGNCVKIYKKYLDMHKNVITLLNEKTINKLTDIDEYDLQRLFGEIPDSIDEDFVFFYENSFEYKRDMELLQADIDKGVAEEVENRLLEGYEQVAKSERIHEADMALNALGMLTEALNLIFSVLELEYEKDDRVEEYLELADDVLAEVISLLYAKPYAVKKVLREKRPDILEKAEEHAETLEETARVLTFIGWSVRECTTSKQLMDLKNSWMKTLEIKYISQEKVEEVLDAILNRLTLLESEKESYREGMHVIASYLECAREYEKDSVKAALATGEVLYNEYVAGDGKLDDYGCIGIMYYRALEDLANKLLYTPYYCQVLRKQEKKVMLEPEKYVGRLQNFVRKGAIKESCEIGTLGFLLKDIAERTEYAEFLKKWLHTPVDYGVIAQIGEELIKVSKRRNDMAHGGKRIGRDTVVVARNNVYVATAAQVKDDLLRISELIRKIILLF